MKKLFIVICIPILVFAACESETIIEPPIESQYEEGVEFMLEFNETKECTCGGPLISFTQLVEESRCPTEVVCIWGGQVIVQLDINEQAVELGLSSQISVQAKDTIGQWTIELLAVRPHPVSSSDLEDVNAEDYEIDLIVESL